MLSEFLDSEVLHISVTLEYFTQQLFNYNICFTVNEAAFAFYFVGSVYSTEMIYYKLE